MKALQKFSKEYLEECKKLSIGDILQFLEDFRELHSHTKTAKNKNIRIKIPEHIHRAFQTQCQLRGPKYQTQIKALMEEWLKENS